MTNDRKNFTKDDKRAIKGRFKRELERVWKELDTLESTVRTLTSLRSWIYFPSFGYNAVFAGMLLASGFDLIIGLIWMLAFYKSILMVISNFGWLDGKNGKYNYVTEQIEVREELLNEGILVDLQDTQAQCDWLELRNKSKKLSNSHDHPFHNIDKDTQEQNERSINCILRCLKIAFPFFLLNSLPWFEKEGEGSISGMTKAETLETLGSWVGIFPDYLILFFYINSYASCC